MTQLARYVIELSRTSADSRGAGAHLNRAGKRPCGMTTVRSARSRPGPACPAPSGTSSLPLLLICTSAARNNSAGAKSSNPGASLGQAKPRSCLSRGHWWVAVWTTGFYPGTVMPAPLAPTDPTVGAKRMQMYADNLRGWGASQVNVPARFLRPLMSQRRAGAAVAPLASVCLGACS